MRVTIKQVQEMKERGERFAMLTAYDYPMAKLLDEAGVPLLLVGDSMGVVVLGYPTTLNVSMEDIIRSTQAVVRGSQRALVVADLPFMSYQVSADEAVRNAGRLLTEGGAQAVKLEGGVNMTATARRIVECGIPLMGHVGLTPQSVNQFGGYKVQGKTLNAAARILADAVAMEEAGAFSIVLEGVPAPLAERITRRLGIPTIGIGAGPHCDGQVQVLQDMLGLFTDFIPRHARRYAQLGPIVLEAARQYAADVASGTFPSPKESFSMDESILREIDAVALVSRPG
ncbi:MAG: 3-methyl-2-oxobutanoate hydroxymethyltransferase [Chloroflexi bacterium]|nr:3-methyl-2-oxobutanoate hydroxymethyltransferase [Chloroflexota bacterium]